MQAQAAFLLFAYAEGPGSDPSNWVGRWLEQRAVWINLAFLAAAVLWARPSVLDPLRRSGWRRTVDSGM